jgi:hypothetical protein
MLKHVQTLNGSTSTRLPLPQSPPQYDAYIRYQSSGGHSSRLHYRQPPSTVEEYARASAASENDNDNIKYSITSSSTHHHQQQLQQITTAEQSAIPRYRGAEKSFFSTLNKHLLTHSTSTTPTHHNTPVLPFGVSNRHH